MPRTPLLDRLATRARQREGVSEWRDDYAMKAAILPEDLVVVADTDLYLWLSYSLDHSFFYVFIYLCQTYCKTFLFALFDLSLDLSP